MTISKKLLLSILSMDAYNQGYSAGIVHGETQIGAAAEIALPNAIDVREWQAAGFYAVAYEVNGKTVISIRGTDDKSTDIPNGYGVGYGEPDGIQAEMAIKFYKSVIADKLIASDPPRTAGILTAQQ